VVRKGPLRGKTLHELWTSHRGDIFGDVADAPRFPLLVKLLDAREKLSVQVHPPNELARELGGEAKSEFWYIADAASNAELYVGVRGGSTRQDFEEGLRDGNVARHVHRIPVKAGDAIFLPSGRVHAIGAGNLIVEIQQNSDTTYRVFDWNRPGTDGKPRKLHIEESLRCIDFADYDPALISADGERLVRNPHFQVEKWKLDSQRVTGSDGKFAIVFCLAGEIQCGDVTAKPGEFFLVPSSLGRRALQAPSGESELLRITIP
jgi:mannose-6-phosphate isomerase